MALFLRVLFIFFALASLQCGGKKIETLNIIDEVVGTGAVAEPGKKLTVHYTGMLTNGKVFDSSRLPGRQPFEFVLGQGMVIAGWDEGLKGMRVGGKRRLEIPPHLGYGNQPVGEIPPNSALIFDIELLDVE
ncbi:MAG: FKBP-type peptidyl-prolyl cis-trans isomerase [Candidatus Thermochlorobacter aerophilum]|jgi:peptidylprolyl isomerase|uniref:Peptidyl-prolyl cis-trans isomerase n=1 Tax=Candidatus Thermochlorobacter aerophilus TaxID=1868324 RepID=A0A395M129_9BACT|nr:MAG: FKBP-type peptidyl-prolyl cis-trans isomerase [Candidatus Thermochlorobacter aerophilum]